MFDDPTGDGARRDTEPLEREGEEDEEGTGAESAPQQQVVVITNPHVCDAARARFVHRKRPCQRLEDHGEEGGGAGGPAKRPAASTSSLSAHSTISSSLATVRDGGEEAAAVGAAAAAPAGAGISSSSASAGGQRRGSGGASAPASVPPRHPSAASSAIVSSSSSSFASASASRRRDAGGGGGGDADDADKLARMTGACRTILECIGEDPDRDGLAKTPLRWAKSLLFMTSGYALAPRDVANGAVFEENHDEMVVVRNIDIYSLCEHHMVPFTGRVHVGYIPNGKVLGLSKLARIAELYARRLQVQERLTRQIADAVVETVEPLGVAVVVECSHLCMVMRGVQKASAVTTTSSVRGCFESNPKTRAEFFSIIHGSGVRMC